jgi:protein Tex
VTLPTFDTWFPTQCPSIPLAGASAVVKLADDNATVPFIARYRKEQTGNLDEVKIQAVLDAKERWDDLLRRQAFIVEELERQKKLTPELRETILSTFDRARLEDLYLPFKSKRKSRATLAREAGIEPLADWIWNCGHGTDKPLEGQTLELWAFTFRNEEAGYKDVEAVLVGALDILTERLSELADLRQLVRDTYFQKGVLRARKGEKAKPHSKYETYFEYGEKIPALLKPEHSHRYLAARRGWMESELVLTIGGAKEDAEFEARLVAPFEAAALTVPESPGADLLRKAARAALKGYVIPAIENEVHKALKDVADVAAIAVFAENVRQLLLASPYGPKAVLGVDPGVRTGCKLAVVDDAGQFLASTTLKLRTDEEKESAKKLLAEMLAKTEIRAVAVGNGTAGRETQSYLSAAIKELGHDVPVVLVSETGASVYSASTLARE